MQCILLFQLSGLELQLMRHAEDWARELWCVCEPVKAEAGHSFPAAWLYERFAFLQQQQEHSGTSLLSGGPEYVQNKAMQPMDAARSYIAHPEGTRDCHHTLQLATVEEHRADRSTAERRVEMHTQANAT